ncbi:MAG: CopG family ribbon-helix-helix protein [Promethearchaeota archaeon]
MKIISLQVSDDLLERFESVRIKAGFGSKSEALRDAIVKFIETHEKFENLQGYKVMALNLVYVLKENISDKIAEIASRFHSIIKAITDWRIAGKKIELMLVVGEVGIIKDLYLAISQIKEVNCSVHEIVID